jgi:long-chain acyl-CoA synthetase
MMLAVPLLFEKMANGIRRRIEELPGSRRLLLSAFRVVSRVGLHLGYRPVGRFLFGPLRKRAGLGSLRMLVSGGAALPADVAAFFDTIGLPLVQGYGLSEASPVVTVNRPEENRCDTVGPPLPGVEIEIRGPDADGIGEIAVRGPMIMKGYWKRPEDTKGVLQAGWLLTGDLGRVDRHGHLHIAGRLKNVIISGAGKNIYPEELESLLNAQPEVAESMIYGHIRPGKIGETVAAIIVPDREMLGAGTVDLTLGAEPVQNALSAAVRRVNEQMASYKRITEWDMREEPFEKTATRKIKRYLLTGRESESKRHSPAESLRAEAD